MNWEPPLIAQTWMAIDTYLAIAYEAAPPLMVRARIDSLRAATDAGFYHLAAFERMPPEQPHKLSLRLGNRYYPHMKLVIERLPTGVGSLFRADTHDRHVQPKPDSPEAAAFAELARKNEELARQIEARWEEIGLPTFKGYLREHLARRLREQQGEQTT